MNFIKSVFRFIKTLITSVILVCFVIFMVTNRQEVSVSLSPLPFVIETRVFIVMIFTFAMGVLFGFLAISPNLIGKTITNFRNNRKIKKLEKAGGAS